MSIEVNVLSVFGSATDEMVRNKDKTNSITDSIYVIFLNSNIFIYTIFG